MQRSVVRAHPPLLAATKLAEPASGRAEIGFSATMRRPVAVRQHARAFTQRKEMATGVRVAITLACTDCKRRNYQTQKSKRNSPDRVEFKKYCRWCSRHTAHRETR